MIYNQSDERLKKICSCFIVSSVHRKDKEFCKSEKTWIPTKVIH